MNKNIFLSLVMVGSLIGFSGFVPTAVHAETTSSMSSIKSGDLIRGTSLPAVYYMGADGFRYVFPNDKTYFTWYTDFSNIKWLSDADLGTVQIGGNVTYRPGVKMIKINSDPKTYAVGNGGELHWVSTESAAVALYGSNWNTKIDDVPDGFFSNYHVVTEEPIATSSDYSISAAQAASPTINDDKQLQKATLVNMQDYAFSPTAITIKAGTAVRFENHGSSKHTATADDLSWGSGTIEPGGNFSKYFKTKGTYTYFCSYHSSMTGTIIVE